MELTATKRRQSPARKITAIGMMTAISVILSFFEFSIPFLPAFIKLDISDLPALLVSFAYGPLAGVGVVFLKGVFGVLRSSTGGIGELANFLIGAAMVLTSGLIYRFRRTRKGAVLSLAAGCLMAALAGALSSYYILLPLYNQFMPMDELIAAFASFIPIIRTKLDTVVFFSVPFNFIKGMLLSLITLLLYKKLIPLLKKN